MLAEVEKYDQELSCRMFFPDTDAAGYKEGSMKANRKKLTIGLLLLMAVLLLPQRASYAATQQLLFNLLVKDGVTSKTVPVYEYTNGTSVKVKAAEGYRTLSFARSAAKARFYVRNKTAYFKNNYKSIKLMKKVTLTDKKTIKLYVTNNSGKKKTLKLTLTRPSAPKFTSLKLSRKSITTGSHVQTAAIKVNTKDGVTCTVKIFNSKSKLAAKTVLSGNTGDTYTYTWDGKAGSGNKLGLSAGSYVPAGKYKMTVYLRYKNGTKDKIIKKSVSFTVKAGSAASGTTAAASAAGTTAASTVSNPVTSVVGGKAWPWKVILIGDKRADYLAEYICQQVLTEKMTEVQRAKTLYGWCASHFTRKSGVNSMKAAASLPEKISITSAAAKAAINAYETQTKQMIKNGTAVVGGSDICNSSSRISCIINVMNKQVGDCFNMAYMYEALCRHAGLNCDLLQNTLPVGGYPQKHCWNAVQVNGVWYECDARISNARGGKDYSHCLRGKDYMEHANPGNGANDARVYDNIHKKHLELYAKVSNADCPGR